MGAAGRRRPGVAGHRGASSVRPENTLTALHAAIGAGADAIEFDVHATADGELVVIHDYDLLRTTDGDGFVHERTLDYVRSLSAGRWFDGRYAAKRVPLLAEALAFPPQPSSSRSRVYHPHGCSPISAKTSRHPASPSGLK